TNATVLAKGWKMTNSPARMPIIPSAISQPLARFPDGWKAVTSAMTPSAMAYIPQSTTSAKMVEMGENVARRPKIIEITPEMIIMVPERLTKSSIGEYSLYKKYWVHLCARPIHSNHACEYWLPGGADTDCGT